MKYCLNCQQLVDPQKKFNWGAFLCLLCCCGLGVIYLIYYLLPGGKKCPMCNSTNWGVKPKKEVVSIQQQVEKGIFCPNCGTRINEGYDYCTGCGKKI